MIVFLSTDRESFKLPRHSAYHLKGYVALVAVMVFFIGHHQGKVAGLEGLLPPCLKIVLATDAGSYPWKLNQARELEYWVDNAGFIPMDAIKSGTSIPAELLGRSNELSQIKEGYIADIIAVKGNPINDITLLQNVEFVMKGGIIYKRYQKQSVQQQIFQG
jgi:hypothetical protein